MSKFNLEQFNTEAAANAGAVLEVELPNGNLAYNGEELVTITLLGAESDAARKSLLKQQRANSKKRRGSKVITERDLEEAKRQSCEFLADLTTGWTGIDKEFNRENVIDVYMKYKGIRDQVNNFVADSENFTQK